MIKSTFISFLLLCGMLFTFAPQARAQYQFGYLSYQSALKSLPEYDASQKALLSIKEKYDNEARYNEEKFRKMFADFLTGQKTFPQEIMLKRQKELQVAMEQGIAFRKDAENLLNKAESDLMAPLIHKLDSVLNMIGMENGLIFILNTDGGDFPFIHTGAGKDLTEIVAARLKGQIIPLSNPAPADPASTTPAPAAPATPATQETVPPAAATTTTTTTEATPGH